MTGKRQMKHVNHHTRKGFRMDTTQQHTKTQYTPGSRWEAFLLELLEDIHYTPDQETARKISPIDHTVIRHQEIPVTWEAEAATVRVGHPRPHTRMQTPTEQRYCLASLFPSIQAVDAYTLRPDPEESDEGDFSAARIMQQFRNDPMGLDWLYTFMTKQGHDLYGGTSLNKGSFYGVDWPDHTMTRAAESLGYLSLLFTPFATTGDGQPLVFTECDVLVVSAEEYEATGLPAGYGTALTWSTFGQFRAKIGDHAVGKGLAVGFETARDIGLDIPDTWTFHDLVICEEDMKIHPVEPGRYTGAFGITWDNVQTIHGQAISLGYEFWQFIQLDDHLVTSLRDEIAAQPIPDYESMVLGTENARQLAAARNGAPYQPLELHSKLMEALTVLGSTYPWVAQKLEPVVINHLLTRPFPGTRYKLAVVVNDRTLTGTPRGSTCSPQIIGGKYPVTAGLMPLHDGNSRELSEVMVLARSMADQCNIDSDGDCVFLCEGALFTDILDRDLLKPIRDIAVQARQKHQAPLTLQHLATQGWQIFTTSSEIGALTVGYYATEVVNDVYGMDIDLQPYYQGIEAVIKSAKWDMDLTVIQHRDWDQEATVKELVAMPYSRRSVNALRRRINTGMAGYDVVLQQQIATPLHYMDHVWNSALDRCEQAVNELRSQVQPLSVFSERIGPVLLPDNTDHLDQELKDIQSLSALWRELRPGGQLVEHSRELVTAVTQAGQVFAPEALRIAVRNYCAHSRGSGAFPIHLGYGQLAAIFGQDQLQYTVPETARYHCVRIWNAEIDQADFQTAQALTLDEGLPVVDDILFVPGDGYQIEDFSGQELVTAFPYLNRSGRLTKSLWLVTQ